MGVSGHSDDTSDIGTESSEPGYAYMFYPKPRYLLPKYESRNKHFAFYYNVSTV